MIIGLISNLALNMHKVQIKPCRTLPTLKKQPNQPGALHNIQRDPHPNGSQSQKGQTLPGINFRIEPAQCSIFLSSNQTL